MGGVCGALLTDTGGGARLGVAWSSSTKVCVQLYRALRGRTARITQLRSSLALVESSRVDLQLRCGVPASLRDGSA